MALDILIVDDERDIRDLVSGVLEDEGYQTRTASNSDAALDEVDSRRPSLVLLDVWLSGSRLDGLELLEQIKRRDPDLPVLMISGHGTLDTAVAAISRGASDFIEKPFDSAQLLRLVARATETQRLRRENEALRAHVGVEDELTGNSTAINAARALLKRVASTNSRVLVTGPAGVGKEVAARLLHAWSGRADQPFVVVPSASMEPERVEEALFGSERPDGVATPGLMEKAHGGTLFLDEVADMPLQAQAKILRVLSDQSFTRIGGQRQVRVDVRVVSSSARELEEAIADRSFREDLFYRLNVVPVRIPPLAARREDVPPLVERFLTRFASERRLRPLRLANDAVAALQAHDWPGNVRELRNVVERIVIMAPVSGEVVEVDALPREVLGDHAGIGGQGGGAGLMAAPLREARETFEREYLRIQVQRFSGNISRTATFVGMERSALHRKLKLLGLTDLRGEGE